MINPSHTYGDFLLVEGHELTTDMVKTANDLRENHINKIVGEWKEKLTINRYERKIWMLPFPGENGKYIYDENEAKELHADPITAFIWKTVPETEFKDDQANISTR